MQLTRASFLSTFTPTPCGVTKVERSHSLLLPHRFGLPYRLVRMSQK